MDEITSVLESRIDALGPHPAQDTAEEPEEYARLITPVEEPKAPEPPAPLLEDAAESVPEEEPKEKKKEPFGRSFFKWYK
jgi:hypothetical protein